VLETAAPQETLGGKPIRLRRRALWAYRRMVAAARRAGVTRDDPQLLDLFSGYRDPAADAARCAQQGNCQGLVRAACSAHRTGLAIDLDLGSTPGLMVDNSSDANRLYQTQTPAYRWLVRNARRFGFVNYVFEPWHWEWTGEAP
jgi:LAS superfamily LD-carboxypeptidase LdcB